MRKLILLLFLLPTIAFGQTTLIPDPSFEQALIDLGYDTGTPDGSVETSIISSVGFLNVSDKNISDLTGIQEFTALHTFWCSGNELTSLDVSQNNNLEVLDVSINNLIDLTLGQKPYLTNLWSWENQLTNLDLSNAVALQNIGCSYNQLSTLDMSNNPALLGLYASYNELMSINLNNNAQLLYLECDGNELTNLDLSNNTQLISLECDENQLSSLDLSDNASLVELNCHSNQLNCLNLKNGNNTNITYLFALYNPNLSCIGVDDAAWSTANWTSIDPQASFSEDCNYPSGCFVGIPEPPTKPKELLYITDILGRTTHPTPNTLLFYLYDDGSVEKRIQLATGDLPY